MFWNPGSSYIDINARSALIFYSFLFNIILSSLHCFFKRFSIFNRITKSTRDKQKTFLLEEIETYKKLCKAYDTNDTLIDYVKTQRILCEKERELHELEQNDIFSGHSTSLFTFLLNGDSRNFISFLLLSKAFSICCMFLIVKMMFPQSFSERLGFFDVSGAFFISQTAQHQFACYFRKLDLGHSTQSDKKTV